MRSITLSGVTGLAMAIAFGIQSASAFSGSYTVRLYGGPDHTAQGNYCVVFTPTNNISGFPDSGTWDVPIFGGEFNGNYVVDGTALHWYGSDGGPAYTLFAFSNRIKANGKIAPGTFDAWGYSDRTILAAGSGITTLKHGC
jgi:hypothetical protein